MFVNEENYFNCIELRARSTKKALQCHVHLEILQPLHAHRHHCFAADLPASLDKERSLGEITQLKSNIQALQTEIHRRDEISEHSAKDADRLRTQLSELTQEKEQLKTELDIQTQKFEQAADIGPVATLEAKVEQLSEQLYQKDLPRTDIFQILWVKQ